MIDVRRGYAQRMMARAGITDPALEAAFAAVPREDFLPDPPWTVVNPGQGPVVIESHDREKLYDNVLVALDPRRGVNNGSPALHALMLHRLGVRPGDQVVHIGAGAGYYSALLAELVGPAGHVLAVEYDASLADAAQRNLAQWENVRVLCGDGASFPVAPAQRIYVNFAVARPASAWLDWLQPAGTLVFPLGVPDPDEPGISGQGAVLLITRSDAGYAASFVSRCAFVCAEGRLAGGSALRTNIHLAFQRGGVEFVASLRRGRPPPERCFFWSPQWSLWSDPP